MADEEVLTSDLGGAQQLLRAPLPPEPQPKHRKHPLDGAHGLGMDQAPTASPAAPAAAAHEDSTTADLGGGLIGGRGPTHLGGTSASAATLERLMGIGDPNEILTTVAQETNTFDGSQGMGLWRKPSPPPPAPPAVVTLDGVPAQLPADGVEHNPRGLDSPTKDQ